MKKLLGLCLLILPAIIWSCGKEETPLPKEDPDDELYRIPLVIHIVHHGEPLGQGYNLSLERIEAQLRILNEDYRRKPGTPGYNDHPDGGDAKIEFVLATVAPDGSPTTGIERINAQAMENPVATGSFFDFYAYYGYWDPKHYINVWTMPMGEDLTDVFLGKATGPETDLPGSELFEAGEPYQAEGILINSAHFGPSEHSVEHHLGRTLTHELGHYFGLLHTWGKGDCAANDYCEDTPPVSAPVKRCGGSGALACDGQPAMAENFMNYAPDHCLNIFTNDQISRMHYVLEHSPRRKTLVNSPALEN